MTPHEPPQAAGTSPLCDLLRSAVTTLGFGFGGVYLVRDNDSHRLAATHPERTPLRNQVLEDRSAEGEGQPEPDVLVTAGPAHASKQFCSAPPGPFARVPIARVGSPPGILVLGGGDPLLSPEAVVPALRAFALAAALALENEALSAADGAKTRTFLALQRIGREMTSTLDIAQLLEMILEEAAQLTGADGGVLYLLEDGGERLCLEAWCGEAPPPGRDSIPVGYGIPGWVARNGRPLRVSDRGGPHAREEYSTRKSQLAVPLLSEGLVVGALAVEAAREDAFSSTHEEILSIFAAQAAKAIEATRFFQQIRTERDLREQILSGTPNGVIALDGDRRVVLMNASALRLLNVDEEPRGNPVERYLSAAGFANAVRRVLRGSSSLESVEAQVGPVEDRRHLLVSVCALGRADNRGATLILQDTTERRRLDERMQRVGRLASIGQLAAGVAHEIRNPLTGIAISLEILVEEAGLSAAGRSLLTDINREIDRLEALVRGILDFARPPPVESRPMRIAKAMEWHRAFSGQCRKRGVEFELDLLHNGKIQGDPERLKQLFLNLAINALDATPQHGCIRIGSEELLREGAAWVRVSVEDSGAGMEPGVQAKIFDPFFTTKNEGTGLGLSIAHSIVDQHNGHIEVTSRPGRGTRFTIDLPSYRETTEE